MNNIIISFYKDPKTGLSINNTYRNLKKAGHNFTLRQVEESIKSLNEYYKARTYKEQKHLFIKTVTGLMTTYQADIFIIKHMTLIKFVALINVETRKAYVYHLPNRSKAIVELFNNLIKDIPKEQFSSVISTDLGSEFNSKDFIIGLKKRI